MAAKRSLYEVDLPATWERDDTSHSDLNEWLEIGPRDVLHARGWHITNLTGTADGAGECPYGNPDCEDCEDSYGTARGSFVLHLEVYSANAESAVRLGRLLAQDWFDQAEYDADGVGIDWCQGPHVTFA